MKMLPRTQFDTLLIRTDFSDQAAWQALCTTVTTPNEEDCVAHVQLVDDTAYSDLSAEQLVALAAPETFFAVADRTTLASPEKQLLVVMMTDQGHDELRVIAEELWSIENNLSVSNMDWEDFVGEAEDDGVFRGFR
ncbi:DUF6924 domain-containing protein [Streptomyces sp. NPDC087659]|uniref:DUF6924 domain-containing protein n=1 Tax=Streptomyces sp. NPDC087659 TaxID=3365801 RepID=UPI0038002DD2